MPRVRRLLVVAAVCLASCSATAGVSRLAPPSREESVRRIRVLSPVLLGREANASATADDLTGADCTTDGRTVDLTFRIQREDGVSVDDVVAQGVIMAFALCNEYELDEALAAVAVGWFYLPDPPDLIPIIAKAEAALDR